MMETPRQKPLVAIIPSSGTLDEQVERLVALCRIVRPHLTIIDGTMGMGGMGPAAGRLAGFGHVFAGRDLLATDTVAAAAMGFGPDEIRLHRLAREAGIGCGDLEQIEVVGARPGTPFLKARALVLGRSESDAPGAIFLGQCALKASRGRKHLKACPPPSTPSSPFSPRTRRNRSHARIRI